MVFIRNGARGLFNTAVVAFRAKDYDKAYTCFNKCVMIDSLAGAAYQTPHYDTVLHYYTALSAYEGNHYAVAIPLYEGLMNINFPTTGTRYTGMGTDVVNFLYNMYKSGGDTTKANNTIDRGLVKYPNDLNLLINRLNLYLVNKHYAEAIATMNKALANPDMKPEVKKQILLQAGLAYEKVGQDDQAQKSYTAAIAVDPQYFDATYELGALYFNQAKKITDSIPANQVDKPTPKVKAMNDRVANLLNNKARPTMEKALSIATQPADKKLAANALFKLYDSTGNAAKAKEMGDLLDTLKDVK
jgi:tetratricopeptide (TPR) repeat protein